MPSAILFVPLQPPKNEKNTMTYSFTKYRSHYGALLRLAAPVVLSQLGQVAVQFADNAMVGRLGALPLAATAFGGSVAFIFFIFGLGITFGLTPIVGALFARNEQREIAANLHNAIVLYTLLGIVITLLQLAFQPIMYRLGQPLDVVEMALPYYRYMAWGTIPVMLYAAFKQFLEGVGNTTTAMVIVVICNSLNIGMNWLFIYGNLGAPEMGAAGAGLATLLSRVLMPILMIVYFVLSHSVRPYTSLLSKTRLQWQRFAHLLRIGLPIATQTTIECSAFVLSGIMIGWFGTVAIAANQITTTLSNAAFMICIGFSSAATIRVSHAYGARHWPEMRMSANAAYHIGLCWNLFAAMMFILLRHELPRIFTSDEAVVQLTASLLIFSAMFQVVDCIQAISIGILRGMKDVNVTMGIAILAYLVINLPVGYLCAFTLGMGPEGIWLGFVFGLGVATVLLNRRYRRKSKELSKTDGPAIL